MRENGKIARILHTFSKELLRVAVAAATSHKIQVSIPHTFVGGLLQMIVVAVTGRSRRPFLYFL